jgi:hypothetical protein
MLKIKKPRKNTVPFWKKLLSIKAAFEKSKQYEVLPLYTNLFTKQLNFVFIVWYTVVSGIFVINVLQK